MEWFHHLDLFFLQLLNQKLANGFLDWFFPRMAAPGNYVLPAVLLGVGLLWKGGARGRLFLLLMGLALLLGDCLLVASLKKAIHRPRPHETVEGVRLVTRENVLISHPTEEVTDGRSFPSGHVCNNVALVMIAVAFYGKKYRWLYLWALFMAWNRVYLGSHYPSDVFFSWMLSLGYTSALLFLFKKQIQKATGMMRFQKD
ncbi:MAG: phosphatase PAP2 family protein [Verrucomicrobiota bacterium]